MRIAGLPPALVFGIYPGGEAGSDGGIVAGDPDDPVRVTAALRALQGDTRPFVVRAYERYSDASAPSRYPAQSPRHCEQYAREGRRLDLVALFQSVSGDVDGFLEFVRALARRHGPHLYSFQITEEANFAEGPDVIDGPYPRVREALVAGVQAARRELDESGLGRSVGVGFSVTPTFGPAAAFWQELGALGGTAFRDALDYVALDFFPDVFSPAARDGQPGDVRATVAQVLRTMRQEWLPAAGIGPEVALHVGENGWPTGGGRTYERQAEVVELVVSAVHELRQECHIARYTAFALRDARSSPSGSGDFWQQFGLLRDDYAAKPAFATYARLVAELGTREPATKA